MAINITAFKSSTHHPTFTEVVYVVVQRVNGNIYYNLYISIVVPEHIHIQIHTPLKIISSPLAFIVHL